MCTSGQRVETAVHISKKPDLPKILRQTYEKVELGNLRMNVQFTEKLREKLRTTYDECMQNLRLYQ